MRSPAAERRRPTLWDGLVALAVVACAVVLLILLRPASGTSVTAVVTLDGEISAQYRLDRLEEPVSLPLDDAPYPLTIRVEPGRICIEHNQCPTQDCVHTGWISRPGQQIICLPNRLVISLVGAGADDFDAVTG